ncbi:PEP-CTERM sorting domain-containing protein [Catenovulum sp. 2E275]|uniref:PEP-CTERM sorting domain-containing protein n=1 Tax=Catenovulum sp. 2E275 TaxID=2980497 RepID=UPI0021D3D5D6|nr:PEP-CTERM sorting domain-containing protein [Catenovulum sp. 2E275]MCU4675564.1 PEP-CTERM sorting domain-containing protein [Catenovulum sp. 2E275]
MKKLALALVISCSTMTSHAATLISNWQYINEAGFTDLVTGTEVEVSPGVHSTLDPSTLDPLAPTGAGSPTNSNNWVLNSSDGLYYDLGSTGYVAGESHTGVTAGASGHSIGSSILSTGTLIDEACWGDGPSCLSFTDSGGNDTSRVEGSASTSVGSLMWNQGTQLTHSNLPTGSPSLTNVKILDGLKLYSTDLLTGELDLIELGIDVIFNETYADATSIWDYAPDDAFIVTLDPALASISSFGADFIDFTVSLDLTGLVAAGYHTDYEIITRISGLDVVSTPSGTTFGLVTAENNFNYLDAQFAIRAVGVPEPANIAIFGFGLLLLGLMKRDKKS